jgi:hypothetical protein
MMEEMLSIQEAQLILTKERDTLRSEQEELKIIYDEHKDNVVP